MSKLRRGEEVKVLATRVPIYAHPGYVPTYKETNKTLVIDADLGNEVYLVTIKGSRRHIGGGRYVPITARLEWEGDGGVLYNTTAKWEVETKEE